MSTPSMALLRAINTLTALTDAVTAFVPYERFGRLFETAPRFASLFLIAVQMKRVALVDTLAVTGNASARSHLARLFLDLHTRLTPLGLVEDDAFDLPLTQEVIGDLLRLTNVHVNRTLKGLENDGLIARVDHRMHLIDIQGLVGASPLPLRRHSHNPDWLPHSR